MNVYMYIYDGSRANIQGSNSDILNPGFNVRFILCPFHIAQQIADPHFWWESIRALNTCVVVIFSKQCKKCKLTKDTQKDHIFMDCLISRQRQNLHDLGNFGACHVYTDA